MSAVRRLSDQPVNRTVTRLNEGQRDVYRWLAIDGGSLWDLLDAVPELVLGRVVAVTSLDSGPLTLSDDEAASGWRVVGEVAYSPPVSDVASLPLGEWDEWYVLDEWRELPELEVFVNYGDFTPNCDRQIEPQGPGWDRAGAEEILRYSLERTERFWEQLIRVQPVGFLAQNHLVTYVTKDEAAFRRALAYARDVVRAAG